MAEESSTSAEQQTKCDFVPLLTTIIYICKINLHFVLLFASFFCLRTAVGSSYKLLPMPYSMQQYTQHCTFNLLYFAILALR